MTLMCREANYEETLEMLTYITGSSCTLALFSIGVYKRPALNMMLGLVRREFWHDDQRSAAHSLFSQFVRTYGVVMPVANVLMCIAPVTWAASRGGAIDSPAALIFRMWTPWTHLTAAKYATVYAAQFIVSLSVLTSISGMVFAMVLVVIEMQVQVDMLTDTISSLRVDEHRHGPSTTAYNNLVECIKHHQTLIA